MKKYLLMLIMLVWMCVGAQAQSIQWYKTTAYAQADVIGNTYYWGKWQRSNMNICFNLNTDKIIIYSPTTQIYTITSTGESGTDGEGGQQVVFYAYDQDGDRCNIRLRIEANGNSQIYVDFADVAWCYNVVRTQ